MPADLPSADIRIGYARCSSLTQELPARVLDPTDPELAARIQGRPLSPLE